MTPTARSMKNLRDRGYVVCRVEQRLHMPKSPFPITKDAFGFGDLLVVGKGWKGAVGIGLVQVTSRSNHSARRAKILTEHDKNANPCAHCMASIWKGAGGFILLQSWAKRGPRGKRKTWQITEESL